ncbi:MAG TPA: acyl-CoA dehydratase activase-related protein [Syntrophomonas sp.]|nr:acyl-CoA dehydratase activase-related protein [Syntrophomonas sp.]
MKRVGIPQGLFYHYYYPLWKTFFEDLGAQVISSGPTNREIVERGIATAVDETCFPVKVYFGHVKRLCDLELDYIFLPRLVSVETRSYICPKFMGVPDMIKAAIPDLPPVIDMLVDLSKNRNVFNSEVLRVGKIFDKNRFKITRAYHHGLEELHTCEQICQAGYSSTEAIEMWEGKQFDLPQKYDLRIAVLGHGYSLYDQTISMNLIQRLRAMGCQVILTEGCDHIKIEAAAATMPKRVFWTLGRKNVGAALHLDKEENIDGMIYLACFGCGPDSMIGDLIERKITNKPFMMITIDEHTGEVGLVTRLEAFCDMLRRRRNLDLESNLPSHGEYAYSSADITGRTGTGGYTASADH